MFCSREQIHISVARQFPSYPAVSRLCKIINMREESGLIVTNRTPGPPSYYKRGNVTFVHVKQHLRCGKVTHRHMVFSYIKCELSYFTLFYCFCKGVDLLISVFFPYIFLYAAKC